MKTGRSVFLILLVLISGCSTLIETFMESSIVRGTLRRGKLQVVLDKDLPNYYAKDADDLPGGSLGTLTMYAGDTMMTHGILTGSALRSSYYLIVFDNREVYIRREDVLTPDDQIFRSVRNPFSVPFREDFDAWNRARDYVRNHTAVPIEIANDNLIKTSSLSDSTSIHYLVTRITRARDVEYEIICRSHVRGFSGDREARVMAFYMVTGRMYAYN